MNLFLVLLVYNVHLVDGYSPLNYYLMAKLIIVKQGVLPKDTQRPLVWITS